MAQINYKPESVTEPKIAKFFFHEKHETGNFHGRQLGNLRELKMREQSSSTDARL